MSHEIRHIYDVHEINDKADMESFVKSLYLSTIKKNKINKNFIYFLDMVYLSLEHELISRNTMIYENFINCNCSKEKLYELFEKSFMYESLMMLNDFNYENLLKEPDILKNTNDFIHYFGGEICKNENDLSTFYQNWKKYFNLKSIEYIEESRKILDNIYSDVKENKHEIKTVKEILLTIHNKYIKQDLLL